MTYLGVLVYLTSVGVLVTFSLSVLGHWSLHAKILFSGDHFSLWLLGLSCLNTLSSVLQRKGWCLAHR